MQRKPCRVHAASVAAWACGARGRGRTWSKQNPAPRLLHLRASDGTVGAVVPVGLASGAALLLVLPEHVAKAHVEGLPAMLSVFSLVIGEKVPLGIRVILLPVDHESVPLKQESARVPHEGGRDRTAHSRGAGGEDPDIDDKDIRGHRLARRRTVCTVRTVRTHARTHVCAVQACGNSTGQHAMTHRRG